MPIRSNSIFPEIGYFCRLLLSSSIVTGAKGAKPTSRCQIHTYKYGSTQNTDTVKRFELTKRLAAEQQGGSAVKIQAMRAGIEKLEKSSRAANLERFQTRRWKEGDVYSPHDLSWAEMKKWREKQPVRMDAFDALAINPLNEYKNAAMMWEYCTSMGRIRARKETGLGPVNQRRIAKAIRRAVGMGLMSSVHKHPEMLEAEAAIMNRRRARNELKYS